MWYCIKLQQIGFISNLIHINEQADTAVNVCWQMASCVSHERSVIEKSTNLNATANDI